MGAAARPGKRPSPETTAATCYGMDHAARRGPMMKALVMVLAVAAASDGAAPDVLPSTGRWTVEYADAMCVLSHDFGAGEKQVTLGFRPWPMGSSTELVLVTREKPDAPTYGDAVVTFGPGGQPIKGSYASWRNPKLDKGVTTLTIDQQATAGLADVRTVTVKVGGKRPVTVAPVGMPKALAALKQCNDDLLSHWGVDPAEADRVATPAQGNPVNWITNDDYPAEALRGEQEGTSAILWTIGTDGKASKCTVVGTSGFPLLDQAACSAVTRRARYAPALDKEGKPTVSHSSRRVVWRLPH